MTNPERAKCWAWRTAKIALVGFFLGGFVAETNIGWQLRDASGEVPLVLMSVYGALFLGALPALVFGWFFGLTLIGQLSAAIRGHDTR